MNIDKLLQDFLFHCKFEKNLNQKTIVAYTIDIEQFKKFKNLKYMSINDINKDILKEYIEYLYNLELKPKSIKRKLATLKAFFSHLEFEEIITISPFRKIRVSIKEQKLLPKTIEIQNIRKLFKYIYKIKSNSNEIEKYSYKALIRDIAILELLFATGLRVSEISNIKHHDFNLSTGNIKVLGKGGKERTIQICEQEVKTALKEYLSLFKDEILKKEWFFINRLGNKFTEYSIANMIKKYQIKANIQQHLTPHMFRHSFATMLLEEGVDIRYIQGMLGHASISTTQIYTQINMKQQRKILSTKHPRRNFQFQS
ncbi:tyrosine-type recombinase/integrase [Aliarcobacter skirrowii]|uniref:Integrase n=1 Tax=Aliarcobacter skirrowii CCUG 10374 TaxID=1032239 RepID=A0AAD0WN88_9BACT|nr:tyrosine-type recombinase/integrase [Aliarcobacter skirrowii]AXX84642.1 site-specific tyrosine recombinase, phage integrase family [Aliarcobacter skirrowii CCUG 10374]KAB0620188.1 tyrosine-type recombinase/integrase [Aliarcobacter skirrowii CCUG 10374]RXI25371.1 integrase [Aliarcobacter skirrowii CCUG 10374]SUV14811.1 Tyrosine recombinase XerD [Aliarcobacter skirrowii]SUV14983.1 Tyrosine recombinase XerD [Aliarcobacter skirrowii]